MSLSVTPLQRTTPRWRGAPESADMAPAARPAARRTIALGAAVAAAVLTVGVQHRVMLSDGLRVLEAPAPAG